MHITSYTDAQVAMTDKANTIRMADALATVSSMDSASSVAVVGH